MNTLMGDVLRTAREQCDYFLLSIVQRPFLNFDQTMLMLAAFQQASHWPCFLDPSLSLEQKVYTILSNQEVTTELLV